jgi:hypothetical protein
MKMRQGIIVTLFLLVLPIHLTAIEFTAKQQRALFIYSFAKYINWSVFVDQRAIIIGISDDDELYKELNKICSDKSVAGKKLKVTKVNGVDAADCQILFLPEIKSSQSRALLEYIRHLQVLVVTTGKNNSSLSSDIVITSKDSASRKNEFHINSENIRKKGMKVSSELIEIMNGQPNHHFQGISTMRTR